jgi:hypothetical protein
LHSYSYIDENPLTGTSYYRLKQTDYNGAATYSGIREVNFGSNASFQVYPNPGNGIFTARLSAGNNTVKIYNELGELVINLDTLEPSIQLNLANSGVYFMMVTNGALSERKKIVINK